MGKAKSKGKSKSGGTKKHRSPKQKAAQRKASAASKRARGGGKSHKKRSGGKKHKKRRSGGGTAIAKRNPMTKGAGPMTMKQFGIQVLKIGGLASLGFIAGEALRYWLLQPKANGQQSALASFESKHGTSPALASLITGLPGVLGGGGLYWAGRKFGSQMLRTAGSAIAVGGVISGGSRLLFGNRFVAEKTGGVQLVQGASAASPGNQLMAPGAGPPAPSAGYGQYQQQPAWKQLGDAFVQNPYGDQFVGNPYGRAPMGDAFVGDPGGSYTARVGDRPRAASGFGITAAEELGE